MASYGLKWYNSDDLKEAGAIADAITRQKRS